MSDEFKEEVIAAPKAEEAGYSRGRGPVEEEFTEGGDIRSGTRVDEDRYESGGADRVLPPSVIEKLEALEAKAKEERAAAAPKWDGEEEETPAETVDPAAPVEPAAAAVTTAPTADDVITPLKAEVARYEAANKQLLADLEAARGVKPEIPALHKLLGEAHDGYIEDQVGAVRRLIAAGLGVDDPNDKRVEDELRDLYTDLTGFVLGVTPDDKHLAKRDAARARHLVARERRERTAEKQDAEQKAKADAEAQQSAGAAQFIGNRLQTKQGDKSISDEFPLLMQFSETLDGARPEVVIAKALEREIKTGRIAVSADDDAMIREAAKLIENHYQALADRIVKARQPTETKPSTAPPATAQAATATARNDQRQSSHGARTITTADRSVAPAAPPAKKPAPKNEKPKGMTKDQQREWALRHLSD